MAFISDRLARIKPSPTIAMTTRAADLRTHGRDIISLSASPVQTRKTSRRVKAAIDAGHTRYTAVDGTPSLKRAIVDKFAREIGLDYAPAQITVGTGGKQILYNALMATLDDGDEVIVPAPYWVSYPDMVLLAGGTPVVVECDQASGFRLTPDALEAAITPRTKWLILNSPSNPSGAGYDRAQMAALCDVLLRHPQVWVLADDIYEHLVFDGFAFCTPARSNPAEGPRPDRRQGQQVLCHDRLAHRLRRGPRGADQGDGQAAVAIDVEPLLDQPVRRRGRADRAAGLHHRQPRGVPAAA